MKTLSWGMLALWLSAPFVTVAAASDVDDVADRLIAAWQTWVEKHGVGKAAIAISKEGQLVASDGLNRDPTDAAPILSVSKMITGICAARLAETGQLDFEAPLDSLVPQLPSTSSIGSLLTHEAGYSADVTQRPVAGFPGFDREYLLEISADEIAATGFRRQAGEWRYNNSHYAMVGAAIAEITGETYKDACGELVLVPAGIAEYDLNPEWRIMSSWGGWKLSAVDTLAFFDHYFDRTGVNGKPAETYPHHDFGNGVFYGLGYVYRDGRNGGTNYWHDGRWHADKNGKKHRYGAYLVRWDNGWAVSVNHNISALNGEHGELDRLLSEASHR